MPEDEYAMTCEGSTVRMEVRGEGEAKKKLELYVGDSQIPSFVYDAEKKAYKPKAPRLQTVSILYRISEGLLEGVPEEVKKHAADALQVILNSEPILTN